jgi:hypothetical protein
MSMSAVVLLLAMTRPAHTCDELGGAARAAERGAAAPGVAALSSGVAALSPVGAPLSSPAKLRPAPPPVAQGERARYRIDYGVVSIGELELAVGAAAPGATIVRAGGHGSGGVLGLGHMDERLSTELDLTRLDSRRWASTRTDGDGAVNDRAEQATAGHVSLVREHPGGAGAHEAMQATFAAPILDPLGFLLRLRLAPPIGAGPRGPATYYVLDGQALWRVTIRSASRAPASEGIAPVATLRFEAEAEPIRYDGGSDSSSDRKHRAFTLWLSDDAARVPLRLQMSIGIADLVVALTEVARR